ncbi:hypothetical protein PRVXH_001602 [Proteinivorax hydrogeniformans]|uniref:Uncharacterized protein n=1 Tax=Proteinivorax hydrogeniformans TaxID=1826727 RepID=A0AAU8HQ98_9FIRM
MAKLVQILVSILVLIILSGGAFVYFTKDSHGELEYNNSLLHENLEFQRGYKYIEESQYEKALNFYQRSSFEDGYLNDKGRQLTLVLRRLINAEKDYTSQKQFLDEVQIVKNEVFEPTFKKLEDMFDLYKVSENIIKEDIYNIDTNEASELLNSWARNKDDYLLFIDELSQKTFPYMTDRQQESLYKVAVYSVTPVSISYRLTHTDDDIGEDEFKLVEKSWNNWEREYQVVNDFKTSFSNSYDLLKEEVEQLKQGYKGIESQLYSLLPNLSKTDL